MGETWMGNVTIEWHNMLYVMGWCEWVFTVVCNFHIGIIIVNSSQIVRLELSTLIISWHIKYTLLMPYALCLMPHAVFVDIVSSITIWIVVVKCLFWVKNIIIIGKCSIVWNKQAREKSGRVWRIHIVGITICRSKIIRPSMFKCIVHGTICICDRGKNVYIVRDVIREKMPHCVL